MIIEIKIDPERLLSIIYALRTEKPCLFQGVKTKDGVSLPVTGTVVATHPETSSFSVYFPEKAPSVA